MVERVSSSAKTLDDRSNEQTETETHGRSADDVAGVVDANEGATGSHHRGQT
ncbi:MAG: hypothetical protein RLZ19_1132, partial [Actinomycetota bacterium]